MQRTILGDGPVEPHKRRYRVVCEQPTTLQKIILEFKLWRYNLKKALGFLFNLAGVPLFVRAGEYDSPLSGYTIKVTGRGIYTKISIASAEGTMDLYFSRLTGTFDGTGYGGSCTGRQCGLPSANPINLPEKQSD